jgi:hypothetical protein
MNCASWEVTIVGVAAFDLEILRAVPFSEGRHPPMPEVWISAGLRWQCVVYKYELVEVERDRNKARSSRKAAAAALQAGDDRRPDIWSAASAVPGTASPLNPIWARPDARVVIVMG